MTDGQNGPAGPYGRWVGVLAVLALVGHGYGLYRVTGPPTPAWFPQADKLEHLVGFAVPTALVLLALAGRVRERGGPGPERGVASTQPWGGRLRARTGWLVVAAFAAHAVLSEVAQHLWYTTRSGDPRDVVADWAGTAAGTLVASALLRRRTRVLA